MNWRRLFDFKGHARRGEYWAFSIGVSVVTFILMGLSTATAAWSGWLALVLLGLLVPTFVVHFAVAARRLHDRGRSGWWTLLLLGLPSAFGAISGSLEAGASASPAFIVLGLATLVDVIWAFVELGILPGRTKGNRYVQDPQKTAAAFD